MTTASVAVNDSTLIEILLAVLSLIVGFVSYQGSIRADKARSVATQADVDADAYNRAKGIYESAIDALEEHVNRLKDQTSILDGEVRKLRASNAELQQQVTELQIANVRLETELRALKGHSGND